MIKFRMKFLCQRHRQFDLLVVVITVRNSLPHARLIIVEGILRAEKRPKANSSYPACAVTIQQIVDRNI